MCQLNLLSLVSLQINLDEKIYRGGLVGENHQNMRIISTVLSEEIEISSHTQPNKKKP